MTKWEYEGIDLNNLRRNETEIEALNAAGTRGWELVGINSCNLAILKRPVAQPAIAATASATSAAPSRQPVRSR